MKSCDRRLAAGGAGDVDFAVGVMVPDCGVTQGSDGGRSRAGSGLKPVVLRRSVALAAVVDASDIVYAATGSGLAQR